MVRTQEIARWPRAGWVAVFVVVVVAILLGGSVYYRNAFAQAQQDAVTRLQAVGELKLNVLGEWRQERLNDALRSASAPFFREALEQWLAAEEPTPLPPGFREQLTLDTIAYGFADALLVAFDGAVIASASGAGSWIAAETEAAMAAALATGEVVMTDPYLAADGNGPFLDTVAVVPGLEGEALAFVILRNDTRDHFFPLIEPWPTPAETAEVMLVAADGDHAIILSSTRHRDTGPMSVRLPLADTRHPVVKAVLGETGVVRGLDYRHEPVMADIRPVPGTRWFLVSKIDEAELFAEARFRTRATSLIILLASIVAATGIGLAYRAQRSRMFAQLFAAERRERRALEEVRTTLYSIGDAVITTDTEGRIRRMNPLAEQLTQWSESEAREQPLSQVFRIICEDTREPLESPFETIVREGSVVGLANHTLLIARDGSERPIADSGAPIYGDRGELMGVVMVFRDQTEDRKAERALRESEVRFRTLYENAAVGILIHDADTGEILDANRKAITDYGFETLEELQSRDIWLDPPYSLEDAKRIIRRSKEVGPQRNEWKSRDIHGNDFWEVVTTFIMPMDGVDRVVTVAMGITELKAAERALNESQAELNRFFDVSLDLLCIADEHSTFLRLNQAWREVLGHEVEDLIGRHFLDFVHPDDKDATVEAMMQLAERRPVDSFVNRYQRSDGTYRYIEWRAASPDGSLIYAGARDITSMRRDDLERRRLLALLTQAEEIAGIGAWELDPATGDVTWTQEVYAIHEVPPDEPYHREQAIAFYHPEDQPVITAAVERALHRRAPYDLSLRLRTARGNMRWVRTSGRPIIEGGQVVRLVGTFQDITEQKLAEEALQRELDFSQRLIANMADGFIILDNRGVIQDVNDAFCALLLDARENLVGEAPPYRHWPPEELDTIQAAFRESLELKPQTYELVFMRTNGERFPVLVTPSYLLDSEGQVTNYFATIKDMTETKRAHEERERLLSAIEQSSESILITDVDGTILYTNPAFERISGYTRDEALQQNPRILKSGEQDEAFYRELWETITAGETWHGRLRNRRKDGSLYTEDATISPVRDQAGNIVNFVAVKRDIGREEELETQLRQAQKMDAVGRLAGGIAHDFNNMLGVILGHTELALEQAEPASPLFEDLQQVQKAGKRSADLTRQLLSFARKQTIAPRPLELNDAITGTLTMLKRLIGENIEVKWAPAQEPVGIRMDPSQLDQILVNLAVNARDAIGSSGGLITISTRHEVMQGNDADPIPGMMPGRYAVLEIADTGCGMDSKTVEHLFEPFFSTKEMGRGTGLGLATVYGIVKQNDGHIAVSSEVDLGSSFRIYLPALHDTDQAEVRVPDRSTAGVEGSETILLVEDEAPLLAVTERFLQRLGYTVISAHGPEAALAAAANGRPIDLLLTDVVMPGMTGREVWERLHEHRPGMKCLFVSGYTADIIADHGVVDESVHFLQKPFTMQALAAKVRDVLTQGSGRE